MSFQEQFKKVPGKLKEKTPRFGALPFTVILIVLELLMDREFSCPCTPGLNVCLVSFIFISPALLALTVMLFIRQPCRRKSQNFTELFLICLIPPLLWMFLLLFEGEYIACGLANWEGDYILDEERQIKWCKPTGINDTEAIRNNLLELTERISFYSKLSALALMSLLCICVMAVRIWKDCKTRPLEQLENCEEQTGQTSLSGSEAKLQRQPV